MLRLRRGPARGARVRATVPTILACAALGVIALPARANHTVDMPLPRMAGHATHVVMGRVESMTPRATDATHGIETLVRLVDVAWLAGAHAGAGDTYDLVAPGGTIGTRTLRLCCAPRFEVGETYVLFLQDQWRVHPVVGLDQGAFRIGRDGGVRSTVSSLPIVDLDRDGNVVLGSNAAAPLGPVPAVGGARTRVRAHRSDIATRPLGVGDFLARVRSEVRRVKHAPIDRPVAPAPAVWLERVPLQGASR